MWFRHYILLAYSLILHLYWHFFPDPWQLVLWELSSIHKVALPISTPSSSVQEFSHPSSILGSVRIYNFCPSEGGNISNFNFNIVFLIPNDNSDFSTLSFQFLFSYFFPYWFLGVIYVFWILKHCLANIFSQYLTCLLFLFLCSPFFN